MPQYNPTTVYTTTTSSTIVIKEDATPRSHPAGLIGFTAGIAIGAAFDAATTRAYGMPVASTTTWDDW
jgi:hypothetical protein